MLTTIEVTQKHIDLGQAKRCGFCPVALAINESLDEHAIVQVSYKTADFYKRCVTGICSSRLPICASNFIVLFDDGASCAPFVFQLDIPEQYLKAAQS